MLKKTIILFSLFYFYTSTSSFAVNEIAQEENIPKSTTDEAQRLVKEGKYVEAQKEYEALLGDINLLPEDRDRILKAYEDLNLKILFSRFETPDSSIHTVVAGDSLYEIAKKYKTTVELIKKSNGLKSDTIFPGMKLKVETGVLSIQVDKSDNILTLFLNDKPVKHYRVATGANNGTPAGQFTIVNKLENPTWYKAGAAVPPNSPENILGTRWLGFDYPGYGIHGTTLPESIGKQVTSGCVRMFNEEVEELYALVPTGVKVIITD